MVINKMPLYRIIILKFIFCAFALQAKENNFIDSSYYKYNSFINKALANVEGEKYYDALPYFDSAFKLKEFVFLDYYFAFDAALKATDSVIAKKYLIKGIINGLEPNMFKNSNLNDFLNSKLCSEVNVDSLFDIYKQKKDTAYIFELKKLFDRDQSNRTDIIIFQKNDSLNFQKLIRLVEIKGFPTFEKVGIGLNYAEAILWHHRDTYPNGIFWTTILGYVRKEIELGNLTPDFLTPYDSYRK